MSTEKTWQMHSTSSVDTEAFGEATGARLKGGEVIELVSDLGGGKTTLVRGLARGAGSTDRVASPTFSISREYKTPQFTIIHFDFYRLAEAGVVAEELREYLGDPHFVVLVEWGEIVQEVLPQNRVTIRIDQIGDESREFFCSYNSEQAYLFEDINT
ncbi:tRNA (adenosine(37)-N6)-threonylcarbamoyltransferase complex ATPase subunit type 1 TsaE [Candidatus Saccharibacteria bacterium]|nr:MAG: tRNA (adenosine(37)-N6)-threonylcarbamoyltransferase complex ATPase subunit type 1 TsaE [Candidatus Saccharibacteria bacterium]